MLPIVLSIAGSDSGGGAGIQADLKTFQAFGTFGTTAVTAVTVQNTRGVFGFHPVPAETVRAQIDVVAEDLRPAALKTGMLASRDVVEVVAAALDDHGLENYVLDPVMVATSGDRLLEPDAERSVAELLLPRAALVTPNLDEASILAGFPVRNESDMRRAAEALIEGGARATLLKGGHLPGREVVDILFVAGEIREWRRPRIETTGGHGTGCTLSAAVAAGLAHGRSLAESVEDALDYVARALKESPGLGSGNGPLNHLVAARS
jgi:hydroxymethylpyrimidine/phosphomethylpyrimidine kinase